MTLRTATPSDAAAMVDLWLTRWPDVAQSRPELVASWEHHLEAAHWEALVEAGDDAVILGFARAHFLSRARGVGEISADVELDYLVVAENARGAGIGRALDSELRACLVGRASVCVLDVESHDDTAAKFWAACGWEHRLTEQNPGPGESSRLVFTRNV